MPFLKLEEKNEGKPSCFFIIILHSCKPTALNQLKQNLNFCNCGCLAQQKKWTNGKKIRVAKAAETTFSNKICFQRSGAQEQLQSA